MQPENRCYAIVGALLAIAALAVGIVLSQLLPPNSGESPPPDESPGEDPRLTAFREQLAVEFNDSTFDDKDSAQYRALEWLALEDAMQLDPNATAFPVLKERYVIALLYFSTNGPDWKHQYSFLSNSSVCSWNEIQDYAGDGIANEGVNCVSGGTVAVIQLSKLSCCMVVYFNLEGPS